MMTSVLGADAAVKVAVGQLKKIPTLKLAHFCDCTTSLLKIIYISLTIDWLGKTKANKPSPQTEIG